MNSEKAPKGATAPQHKGRSELVGQLIREARQFERALLPPLDPVGVRGDESIPLSDAHSGMFEYRKEQEDKNLEVTGMLSSLPPYDRGDYWRAAQYTQEQIAMLEQRKEWSRNDASMLNKKSVLCALPANAVLFYAKSQATHYSLDHGLGDPVHIPDAGVWYVIDTGRPGGAMQPEARSHLSYRVALGAIALVVACFLLFG